MFNSYAGSWNGGIDVCLRHGDNHDDVFSVLIGPHQGNGPREMTLIQANFDDVRKGFVTPRAKLIAALENAVDICEGHAAKLTPKERAKYDSILAALMTVA